MKKKTIMDALNDYAIAEECYKDAQRLTEQSSDIDNQYDRCTAVWLCQQAREDMQRADNTMRQMAEENRLRRLRAEQQKDMFNTEEIEV